MMEFTSTIFILLIQLATILAFYTSSWAATTSNWTVTFPIRNVQRSIDLGTSSLEELHLPSGKCEDYPERNLSLILPQAGLQTVYLGCVESPYVSCLSLRNNQIDKIATYAFNDLPNLLYLDLSKNRISFCDLLTFGGHYKLRTLVLDENEPSGDNIDRSVLRSNCFPRLEHLYLRKNFVRSLQFSLRTAFPRLTHLYLSDNNIDSENCLMDLPICLNHLHIERNKIHNFGGIILRNLLSLFIDGNSVRTVCNRNCHGLRLQGARNLKFLSLSRNDILRIEYDAFYEAYDLVSLNLAHNKIDNLRYETFENLLMLKDFSVEGNRLRVVPNLRRNQLLSSLSLAHNEIQIIETGAFRDLTLLRWLALNDNQIRRIDYDAFVNLRALEELDLSNNKLDHLPHDWIRPQTSLKHLDLTGNYFTCLEHLSLSTASYLAHVYLQNNPVTSVKVCSERALSWFSPDVVVHLTNGCRINANPCYERCFTENRRLYHRQFGQWQIV